MPYRVLVADDSIFMRKIVTDLISEDARFDVVAAAKNGKEAVELTKRLRPDVITMDVEMPEMNGLEALRAIMAERPTPVIMLSSLTLEGADETLKALEWGAVDFVAKPSGAISLDLYKVKNELIERLLAGVQAKMGKAIRPEASFSTIHKQAVKTGKVSASFRHLVAIGTSTGGPRSLHELLVGLPASFAAPILIVQHMPPNFTKSLAQRLHAASKIHVLEAEDGLLVTSGVAYIAPGGWHMRLDRDARGKFRIRLSREEPRNGHRPSVDTLFESLLPYTDLSRHIVLLTGMGSDGSRGMQALKRSGAATTIAEAEESCVVYGMPRAAIELKCVSDILPLSEISGKLEQIVHYSK